MYAWYLLKLLVVSLYCSAQADIDGRIIMKSLWFFYLKVNFIVGGFPPVCAR